MPPTDPGDPGGGVGDEDEFRPPLPPEDRIWRHPSEVAAFGAPVPIRPAAPTSSTPSRLPPRRSLGVIVALSALIGATGSIGLLAASGRLDDRTRVVEREVAVQPVTTSDDVAATLATIRDRTAPSVALVTAQTSAGSATVNALVFRSDGYLLTAAHMIDDADRLVVWVDDRTADATVVGVDPLTDIAVLHVDLDGLDPADIGTPDQLAPGDETFAVGVVVADSDAAVVSSSALRAIGTRATIPDGTAMHGMMLIDRTLAEGTTGCALVDGQGAVIGLTTMAAADADHAAAIPIDVAIAIANQLVTDGRAVHPWLGVTGTDLGTDLADRLGVPGGATIAQVNEDGPAAAAGVRPGDIVTHLDGEPVASMSGLVNELRDHEVGEQVTVGVHRDGEPTEAVILLGERPIDD